MFSSGAIIPARAPPSIAMLQIDMRAFVPGYQLSFPPFYAAGTKRTHLHTQTLDGSSAELDDRRVPSRRADNTNSVEDDILGRDAVRQRSINLDAHVERARLENRLRRKDVLDLGRSDSKGEGSECSVSRGVRVSADDRGAGEGEALFRADDLRQA